MNRKQGPTAYERGLAELDGYLCGLDDAALLGAVEAFRSAVALDPDDSRGWAALGFVLDAAGLADEALASLQRAAGLDPEDHEVEVFVLTLLSESGAEREALAGIRSAAERRGVDLESMRRELADAGMRVDSGTLILNAFIRARNFLQSRLQDEIEEAERRGDPGGWARRRDAERRACFEMQSELQRGIDPQRVPEAFRRVAPWAARLGVGDDFCRGWLAEGLNDAERREVLRTVEQHAPVIQAWLDGLDPTSMSAEAAAFMYLLLSAEEMEPPPG